MRDFKRLYDPALVFVAFACSAIAFPNLPAIVATHWGITGNPDGVGNRPEATLTLPLIMLLLWGLFSVGPRLDRLCFTIYKMHDTDVSTIRPQLDRLVTVTLALVLAVHLFGLAGALGYMRPFQQASVLAIVLSLGIIAIGNYIPRVTRRNALIGIRLPWVYASEEVWRRTQRVGGYGMVVAGVVGLFGAALARTAPMMPLFIALVARSIGVMVYSWRLAHSPDIH